MIRICIFAHYDKDNMVDDYVYYYLNELLTISQKLLFVTVSDISKKDIEKLQKLNIEVIKRENIGYDFYSYKIGIERLDLNLYDELIICNDSVYGPFFSSEIIFKKMEKSRDIWGITESLEQSRHLQSYFIVYKKHVFLSKVFQDFWKNIEILDNKDTIVQEYEVGLSKLLLKNGFNLDTVTNYHSSTKDNMGFYLKRLLNQPKKFLNFLISPMQYINAINRKDINASLEFWDKLILEHHMPFVKIAQFKASEDKDGEAYKLKKILEQTSNYPFSLINNHLNRVCQNEK